MDRFEAMSLLLSAGEAGSLSAVSRRQGVPLATVSRKISELEKHLDCRLLIRGGRKLILTDAGRNYVAACRQILDDVREAETIAAGEYRVPQGELVISAPIVFGRTHLVPALADFLGAYPDVGVRMHQTDRAVNLREEHVDLAVRLGELPDSSLVAVRVGEAAQILCASPAYLEKRGRPANVVDLKSHDCIAFEALTPGGNRWVFSNDGKEVVADIAPRLFVNTADAGVTAAVSGIGIVRALSYQVESLMVSGVLEPLLAGYESTRYPISLVYPSQRQVPLKLRVFLDMMIPRLRESLGYKP